jgi:hypothetical protein
MDIPYVDNSGFLEPCERAIREFQENLMAGRAILVQLDAERPGYPGRVVVEIRDGDGASFGTDWEASDRTRFPARIRAAATGLHNCGCSGRFVITHRNGVFEIKQA